MNRNVGTERILRRYGIAGSVVSEEELCGGNVNLTYKVTVRDGASFQTYLVQKINPNAMPSAKECVRNMALVTDHLQRKGIRYEAGQIAKVWDCTRVIEPSCKFPAL